MLKHTISFLVLVCSFGTPASADLFRSTSAQINDLTARIEKDPSNAEHYFRRGELLKTQKKFEAAMESFREATLKNPRHPDAAAGQARMLLELGKPKEARDALDPFLKIHADHGEGRIYRARAQVLLGDRLAAARDYEHALKRMKEPQPDHFHEWAIALRDQGPDHLPTALRALDLGLRKLGPLVTLEELALELELARGNLAGALTRVKRIIAKSQRQERWLMKKAEILEALGRKLEARQALADASAAIERLPDGMRASAEMLKLKERIARRREGNRTLAGK